MITSNKLYRRQARAPHLLVGELLVLRAGVEYCLVHAGIPAFN